ncbi:hypothetical protein K2Z84_14610, partial [Candidatus Binatia bacterium]|nr:hypothetical protein [Candidatus Binatia bacterium]
MSHRVRTTLAAVALLLLAATAARADDCTAASPGNPCIPGGGAPQSDCALEWRMAPLPAADRHGL